MRQKLAFVVMGLPWLALRRMNGFSPVRITQLGSAVLMGHFLRISATSLSRVARHPSPPSKAGIQGVPEKQSDPRGGRRSNDPKLTPRTCASDHQTVCLDVVLPKAADHVCPDRGNALVPGERAPRETTSRAHVQDDRRAKSSPPRQCEESIGSLGARQGFGWSNGGGEGGRVDLAKPGHQGNLTLRASAAGGKI